MAMAGAALPQAVVNKLADPDRIVAALGADTDERVRVIVEFAAPRLPDATNFANAAAADAAQISAVRNVQDQILSRVFALQGGLSGVAANDDLALKRMDYSPMFALSVDSETLQRLANDPAVLRIHEDRLSAPFLNVGTPTSLERIQMPEAVAAGATGSGWHVAVLDTGGRRSHKFLNARISRAACFGTNDAGQGSTSYCPGTATESFTLDSANDCDAAGPISGCGHGTHVAGTAAGFNNAPAAGEPLYGVARQSNIISINVFSEFTPAACEDTNGCVLSWGSDQIKALEHVYSLRNTINIAAANMSLGGGRFGTNCDADPLKPIIDQLRAAGIATVIAAGNSGYDTDVGAPACISSAITVGSSTKADVRSGFSNWGTLIDIVAPGSDINAPVTNGASNSSFGQYSGTSMAAPHVAGAFAALRSAVPNATVDQIETALKNTGTAITAAGVTKPRMNVNSALTALGGAQAAKAVVTSPAPSSTLPGASVTFQWNAGTNAQAYWLYVGNTVGGAQFHDSGQLGTGVLSRQVTGLPTNGSTVRVRLFTRLAGAWQFNDYTYTAASGAGVKAAITSPAAGSTLAGATVTFQWNAGTNAQAYWLYVGNTVGGAQFHDSGQLGTGVLSRQVTGLPTNGSTVRVRLFTRLAGAWQFNDYTYTAASAGGTKAVMTSPTAGSTLAGATVNFQWSAGSGAQAYWLYVGNTVGGSQFHDSGQLGTGTLSRQVTTLPTDGSTVRVRLYTRLAGAWQFNDYTYTAATSTPSKAVMSSPVAGSTLPGSSVTFQWNAGSQAQAYWLSVGSTAGGTQYHDSGSISASTLSRQVTGLPTNGSTVHARLWTRLGGVWQFNDYSYTAGSGLIATLTSPANGSTIAFRQVFTWTPVTGATQYWVEFGSTQGGRNYYDASQGTATSLTINWTGAAGLPLHMRLWTRHGGTWRFVDYQFVTPAAAAETAMGANVLTVAEQTAAAN
ncbi:MAG: S8 family serine peptidase [Aliihoeflea sp.]